MKDHINFHIPTKIQYGKGEINGLNNFLPKTANRLLIVTDPGLLENTEHISRILTILDSREVLVFSDIEENPTIKSVEIGIAFAQRNTVDYILGIGGGSAMDVAKGVANRVENMVPFACIPTTSGTGSEVTPYAVFTDPDKETKVGFSHDSYFPDFSIIDPELTYSMPEPVILNTGLDALAHAIEAYISMESSEFSDLLALHSINLVAKNLPKAIDKDHKAMDAMSYAAMVSGMAITHTSTILPHIMGYPLTFYHNVPHGRASVLLIPAYLDYLRSLGLCMEKVKFLEKQFTGMNGLRGFLENLQVSLSLKDYGVDLSELPHYSSQTIQKSDIKITPGRITENGIVELYKKSM